MLRKLLPFLNRYRRRSPEESRQNSFEEINVENLIALSEVPVSVINKFVIFTVLLIAVFVALTFVNQGFKSSLDVQKQEQTKLISDLQELEEKQKAIVNLEKKIKFYQNILSIKSSLADKSDFVVDHINPGLKINGIKLNHSEFNVSLSGKNIYLFTQLIVQYLEGDKVGEVSIGSASFDSSKDEFTVELKGVFK